MLIMGKGGMELEKHEKKFSIKQIALVDKQDLESGLWSGAR